MGLSVTMAALVQAPSPGSGRVGGDCLTAFSTGVIGFVFSKEETKLFRST